MRRPIRARILASGICPFTKHLTQPANTGSQLTPVPFGILGARKSRAQKLMLTLCSFCLTAPCTLNDSCKHETHDTYETQGSAGCLQNGHVQSLGETLDWQNRLYWIYLRGCLLLIRTLLRVVRWIPSMYIFGKQHVLNLFCNKRP